MCLYKISQRCVSVGHLSKIDSGIQKIENTKNEKKKGNIKSPGVRYKITV